MRIARLILCLALAGGILSSTAAGAESRETVSLWGGGGVGTMLAGEGAVYVNGHKTTILAVTLPGQKFRLRAMKGSFERTQGIDSNTGDNDLDYEGYDLVVTQAATDLPVDLALGVARYEEAYHVGYPDQDLGGSEFVHRWGPHISAMRSWSINRFFVAWAETDLHFAPYQPQQVVWFVDVGLGVRF